MADEPNQGATGRAPAPGPAGRVPAQRGRREGGPFAERPEVFVGAAFAGGLALALIMRRSAT